MPPKKIQRHWSQTILSSIGDAVIATDADGLITLMNPVAETLTGWPQAEAEGKPLGEVFRIVNEETRQAVENPVQKVRRLKHVMGLANHTILIARNGHEIAIDDSGAPIYGDQGAMQGIVLVFRDVTEERKARKAAAQLAAIVEHSGDAIATKDLNGYLQSWNAGAERLFGYKASEIIGKHVTILFPPDRLNEEDEILHRLREGKPFVRFETVRVAKSGRPIRVSVIISPIKDAEGNIIGASKVLHDVTELASAREALLREKELLTTTLASIGDAVMVTDAEGRITFLNAEAERLTGWNVAEATGHSLTEVFRIINEESRKSVENPVEKVIRLGTVVGLANHTVLVAKNGHEIPIDDSAAPIRMPGSEQLFGVVLVFRDFTERREAMRQLAQSQKTLSELVERAPFGMYIVDSEFRISHMNTASQTGAFRNVKPVIGRDFAEAMHILWPQEVANEIIVAFRRTLQTGEPYYSARFTKARQDIGGVESYEWQLHRIILPDGQHGVISYYYDSTKLRQAEHEVRERSEELQVMLERMPAIVWIAHDPECLQVTGNAAASSLLGVPPQENVAALLGVCSEQRSSSKQSSGPAVRVRFLDSSGRELQWEELPMQRAARTGRPVENLELQLLLPDGREAWIYGSATPLFTANGKVRGVISSFVDVTRNKLLEHALRSNERLALAGRLSASIAHEIHNPLDTVANLLFLLQERFNAQPDMQELLAMAQEQLLRVTQISRNMLSLHRESRNPSSVRLRPLIEEVVSLIAETIAKRRRDIQFVDGFDATIEAFPSELRQVFTNVLKNAVEATDEGGEIRIYSEKAYESGKDGVLVRIMDNGTGIPEQLQSKLFTPFSSTKEESGTGLGLWVSRSIVERHGGSIRLGNIAGNGRGTTVSVFLPLRIGSKDSNTTSSKQM